EAITGFETKNKYAVKTSLGQTLFFAAEKSSLCARCCCGRNRPFHMAVFDAGQREVLSFERPLR
ncbi:MAG: phospholipid scramblase-related protein, partial [Pseudomonadota bacterium]